MRKSSEILDVYRENRIGLKTQSISWGKEEFDDSTEKQKTLSMEKR